jgi:hypothetical protein
MADLTPEQQEQEEFEFRARAEEEARQQAAAKAGVDNTPQDNMQASGPIAPSMVDKAVGAIQTVGQLAAEHPGIAAGGAALWKASNLANKYLEGQQAAAQAANQVAQTNAATSAAESASKQFTNMQSNYTKMGSEIRQYTKAGQPIPQDLLDSHARLGEQIKTVQSRMPGYNPNITGTAPGGPMPPQQPAAMPEVPRAPMAPNVGGQAAEHANIMSKIADLYKAYGPALADHLTAAGKAIAESGAGKALGTVARVAGSTPALGAQLALYSGGLNTNEDAELAKKHALESQMMAQKWGNSPTPNAVNSGFTGQLNNLQRRNP